MRAEEFVGRADEKIGVERADIDGAVRRVVDGVDKHERASSVGELGDFGHGIDRAYGVGGVADGDEFCFAGDFLTKIVEVERAVGFVDFGLADDAFTSNSTQVDLAATDANGRTSVPVDLSKLPDTSVALQATVSVDVNDPAGRAVGTSTTLPIRPGAPMIGIAEDFAGDSVNADSKANFRLVAVAPDGKRVAMEREEDEAKDQGDGQADLGRHAGLTETRQQHHHGADPGEHQHEGGAERWQERDVDMHADGLKQDARRDRSIGRCAPPRPKEQPGRLSSGAPFARKDYDTADVRAGGAAAASRWRGLKLCEHQTIRQ